MNLPISLQFEEQSLTDLKSLSGQIKDLLNPPSLLLLSGPLGAGKTTLVKALMEQYDLPARQVKSPTFSLINIYQTKTSRVAHLDLYRLTEQDPLLLEEIKELLQDPTSLVIIEWPEKLDLSSLHPYANQIINLKLAFTAKNFRNISLHVTNNL